MKRRFLLIHLVAILGLLLLLVQCKKIVNPVPKGDKLRIVYYYPRGSVSGWSEPNMFNFGTLNNYFWRPLRVSMDVFDTTFFVNTTDSLYFVSFDTDANRTLKAEVYLNDIQKVDYDRYWSTKATIPFELRLK
jgi:hypothetical protein